MRKGTAGLLVVLAAAAAAAVKAAPWPADLPPPAASEVTLPAERFAALHRAVQPPPERWLEVGWETELAAARRRALEENRPLFMWVMDGHPLGCT